MTPLEITSAIASTVMSTVVSIVALVFSYRQNVGWKPVALVTDGVMSGSGGSLRFKLAVTVEFWNRRKYPVALRHARANLSGVKILDVESSGPSNRHFTRNNISYRELGGPVEPSSSEKFTFEVEFKNQSIDALRPLFDICIDYFDPHQNRHETTKIEHKFLYPHLGWEKSKEQIDNITRVFREVQEGNKAWEDNQIEKATLREVAKAVVGEGSANAAQTGSSS